MNGFCFIVHVFCMEQKKNTHRESGDIVCTDLSACAQTLTTWPAGGAVTVAVVHQQKGKKSFFWRREATKSFRLLRFYFIISCDKKLHDVASVMVWRWQKPRIDLLTFLQTHRPRGSIVTFDDGGRLEGLERLRCVLVSCSLQHRQTSLSATAKNNQSRIACFFLFVRASGRFSSCPPPI